MMKLERSCFSLRTSYALAVAAVLAVLPGCTSGGSSSDETTSGGVNGNGNDAGDGKGGDTNVKASAYVAAGSIVDTRGKPLSNVEVVVDNQARYDANVLGTSGSDGRYRIELPHDPTTWHVTATHYVEYHGTTYSFPLHPSDDSVFAGDTGGIRNFEWKLTGTRPDDGFYGAFVVGYTEPADFSFDLKDVELTLTPDGPIVDGSAGETITGKLVSTADGEALQDIPLGRYTITAKVGDKSLVARIRNGGTTYENQVTSDFAAPYGSLPIYNIELELKLP